MSTDNLIALDSRRRAKAIQRRLPETSATIIAERRMELLDAVYPVAERKSLRQRRARVMQELKT